MPWATSRRYLKGAVVCGLLVAGVVADAASPERLYLGRTASEWTEDLQEDVPAVRRRAALALGRFGAVSVAPLIEALADRDFGVRAGAARALGEIGADARGAIPALTQALVDEHKTVRQSAEEALKKIEAR
jgi:HEAT repeat protein